MNSNQNEIPPRKTLKDLSFEEQQEHLHSLEMLKQKEKEFESAQKISPDIATEKQLAKEKEEYLAEKNLSIQSIKDRTDIERVTREATIAARIPHILDGKPDGGETYTDYRKPEEKQHSEKNKSFKNFATKLMAGLGLMFAGKTATAKNAETTFRDSTGTGKEKTINDSSSKEHIQAVSNKLRNDWNAYVDWLKKEGLAGSEALDKNDLGNAMIDRYKKEHPETSVSRETIDDIQYELQAYRQWVIDEVRAGKAAYSPGVTEKNFMNNLSKIDNWAGSKTSQMKFPADYTRTYDLTALDYQKIAHKSANAKDIEGMIDDITVNDGTLVKTEKTFATRTSDANSPRIPKNK